MNTIHLRTPGPAYDLEAQDIWKTLIKHFPELEAVPPATRASTLDHLLTQLVDPVGTEDVFVVGATLGVAPQG